MTEIRNKRGGCLIPVVCFIGSVVLFFVGIIFGIAHWQSDIVPGFLISWALSLVLFITGIIILLRSGKTAKTTDGLPQKEVILTEEDIRKQKKTAYTLGIFLIVIGILSSFFGTGLNILLIALGVGILIWAWFRPVNKGKQND